MKLKYPLLIGLIFIAIMVLNNEMAKRKKFKYYQDVVRIDDPIREELRRDKLLSDEADAKILVINLWATWCKPCVAEIPMLNEIKSEYKHKNVEFLSLSVDTDSIKLNSFLKKGKFEYVDITLQNLEYRTAILNFLENKPADNKINSYSVPVTYLIKDKKILKKIDGGLETKDELTGEIDKILK